MLKLKCVAQNYEWGLQGLKSAVGRLYALGNSSIAEEQKHYAELWMGTHPSGPSEIQDGNNFVALQDWLQSHPEFLGETVRKHWGNNLPFLFKVLSVAKALSIQAHPDKNLAKNLHATQPKNYKDANHKPEMALAVTRFEALCGFVHLKELAENIHNVPELRAVVGEEPSDGIRECVEKQYDESVAKSALRSAFSSLMTRDKETVAQNLEKLQNRLLADKKKGCNLTVKEELVLRLYEQYPGDVGVFSSLFFNYIVLNPGEAIALAANEPHAYLSGECIECMATSDNVVRAGLTPKYRDTATLCSMLTYNQGPPPILKGDPLDSYSRVYSPPFDEFEIEKIEIPTGESYDLTVSHGPSVMIVFGGCGAATLQRDSATRVTGLRIGDVHFIPANEKITLSAAFDTSLDPSLQSPLLHVYRAKVNSRVL